MLNNFIYAQTKDLFLEKLDAGEVLDEAIVFIEDTKEIWTHGTYFDCSTFDPDIISDIQTEINNLEKKVDEATPLIPITYSELKSLRDNEELVPGAQYRITDYVTTTKQEDTQSAGHQFDIIVTADSENTLNEKARAIQHDGDTYFADSNLSAWEIWYSLDNDTERFAWARTPIYSPETNSKMIMVKGSDNLTYIYVRATGYDENGKCGWVYAPDGDNTSFITYVNNGYEALDGEDYIYTNSEDLIIGDVLDMNGESVTLVDMSYISGKGVIYRMIDEFNNDCPYDFKNIMFKRYTVSINNERLQQFESDIANKYIGFNANETYNVSMPDGLSINDDFKYFFTFDYNNQDFSLNDIGECRHNLIKDVRFLNEDLNYKMLNNIVFVVDDPISLISKNKFESDCYYMTIGHGTVSQIWSNIFDQYCRGCIIISSSIYQNKFGGNFLKTWLWAPKTIAMNNIGEYCQYNTIYATEAMAHNIFRNNVKNNEILSVNHIQRNTFGNVFIENVIISGSGIYDNFITEMCKYNNITSSEFNYNHIYNNFQHNNVYGGKFRQNTIFPIVQYNEFYPSTDGHAVTCSILRTNFGNNTFNGLFKCDLGTDCMNNVFPRMGHCVIGYNVHHNTFNNITTDGTIRLDNCSFGESVGYNNFNIYPSATEDSRVEYISIQKGVSGTSDTYNEITLPVNSICEIKVAKNSSGEIKIYCEADLIA